MIRTQTAWAACDVTLKQLRGAQWPPYCTLGALSTDGGVTRSQTCFFKCHPLLTSAGTPRDTQVFSHAKMVSRPWPRGLYTDRNKVAPVVDTGFQRLALSF